MLRACAAWRPCECSVVTVAVGGKESPQRPAREVCLFSYTHRVRSPTHSVFSFLDFISNKLSKKEKQQTNKVIIM